MQAFEHHDHHAVFVGGAGLEDADDLELLVVEHCDGIAGIFIQRGRQILAEHDLLGVALLQFAPGDDFPIVEKR